MHTYLNKAGLPMIRSCANCIHFNKIDAEGTMGYCTKHPILFAFTMKPTVSLITKPFYLCEQHTFKNEDFLAANSEKVDLKSALKAKDEI